MIFQSGRVRHIHSFLHLIAAVNFAVTSVFDARLFNLVELIGQISSMLILTHLEFGLSYKFGTQEIIVDSRVLIVNFLTVSLKICISLFNELFLQL